tara:strand:+ start:135 stop:410 length:276 start_codon:yes stop_codon:yes gene_type:complete
MRPVEIPPSRLMRATERVVPVEKTRPADAVAKGDKDVQVSLGKGLDAGVSPIDHERVEQIRQAIETGTYPLVPAKIADAMIAAGIMLRNSK